MYKTANNLGSRYQLRYMGYSEAGEESAYTKMGLIFNKFGKMTKDEGRRVILDSLNMF
jgi:hypothetical protein